MHLLKKWYNEKLKYYPKLREDQLALSHLKDCQRVIDIGCGSGRFVRYAPDRIIGIEGNAESVARAKAEGLNVIEGQATTLPFADHSIDGVHCSHVIEHLDPDRAYALLLEIDRVLRVGGTVVFRTPLLHPGFFDEFGHVKPYPPQAILSYLQTAPVGAQAQYGRIKGAYEMRALRYQRDNLFNVFAGTPLSFLTALGNVLLRWNITGIRKMCYCMILKKVSHNTV